MKYTKQPKQITTNEPSHRNIVSLRLIIVYFVLFSSIRGFERAFMNSYEFIRPFCHRQCPTHLEAVPSVPKTKKPEIRYSLEACRWHMVSAAQTPHVDLLKIISQCVVGLSCIGTASCRYPKECVHSRPHESSWLSMHLKTIVSVSFSSEK
jgi:hypothetical protein